MNKIVKITGDKQESFIKIIASQFGVYSVNELKMIKVLCDYDMFQAFYLDKHTRFKLIKALETTENTFSTTLQRLEEKNIIVRNGKTRWFNASFRNLDKVDCIIFKA